MSKFPNGQKVDNRQKMDKKKRAEMPFNKWCVWRDSNARPIP